VGSPPLVGRSDEGSLVDAETSVVVGDVLGATVCTASVDAVGVAWSSEPVGDDDELSVGVTVEVESGVELLGDEAAVSVVGAGAVD
jgi:hypothetical protein